MGHMRQLIEFVNTSGSSDVKNALVNIQVQAEDWRHAEDCLMSTTDSLTCTCGLDEVRYGR